MTAQRLSLRRKIALDIVSHLQDDFIKEHPLRELFWECALRCNLSCRHCGSDCRVTSSIKDMPKEDFGKVLDSVATIADPHQVTINVTGGEPLMRADLEQCGRMMYDKGFPWGMVTNGYGLTPRRYGSLLSNGLRAMTISLDGIGENHNWMRGRSGSFQRASDAIKMVIDSGEVEFDVVTCVNKRSIAELPLLKELLISMGLKSWRLFTIFPAGRAAREPDLQLSKEEFTSLLEFIKAIRKEGRIKASYCCEGFLGNYEGNVRDSFFMCQDGVCVASVLADGSISACPSIRADYHQGNIYTDDFTTVLQTRFQPYRDRSWMKTGKCAECRFFKYCRGNGMHLRDSAGDLMHCNLERIL